VFIKLTGRDLLATGLGWMLDDIDAGNADAAALSSAIGTQQAKEFSALDRGVDALHRLNGTLPG